MFYDSVRRNKPRKWEESGMSFYLHALNDLEKNDTCSHQTMEVMLYELVVRLIKRDKCQSAADLLNAALKQLTKKLSRRHAIVVETTEVLAALHHQLRVYKTAEAVSKSLLEALEVTFGSLSPSVAEQLHRLGVLCQNQAKYEEGESYYRRALKIYESIYDPDDNIVNVIKNKLLVCYMERKG